MEFMEKKKLNEAYTRLLEIERAMKGLAAVLFTTTDDIPLSNEDLSGLGHLLQIFSREINRVEGFLRDGEGVHSCKID